MLKKITGSILTIMLALAGICAGLDSLDHSGEVYAASQTDIKTEIAAGEKVVMKHDGGSTSWHVLNVDSSNQRALLLSDSSMGTTKFNESYGGNDYNNSDAQTWCRNFFNGTTFSTEEKALILDSGTITDGTYSGYTSVNVDLSTDRVFFLSAYEWNEYKSNASNINSWWWLRSGDSRQGQRDYAGDVRPIDPGANTYSAVGNSLSARPAFYLNLNSDEIPATYDSNTSTWTIEFKKELTVSGITANSKVYDGTATADLDVTQAKLEGVLDADKGKVEIDQITGVYTDGKNVGTDKPIEVTVTLKGDAAGNYEVAAVTGLKSNVTKQKITVSGITAQDKDYDGNTTATVVTSGASFDGIVGEDKLSITATGVFVDANVGTGKTVNLTLGELDGTDKGNYELAASGNQETTTATIKAIEMAVSATGYDGTYDENNHQITVTVTAPASGYTIKYKGPDDTEYSTTNPGFQDPGDYVVSYEVTADNYKTATGTATVKITGADFEGITSGGYSAAYDGNAHGITVTVPDTYSGYTISYSATETGTYSTDPVTYTDFTDGAKTVYLKVSKKGYNDFKGSNTVNITKRSVTVSGITASNKIYDGDTDATLDTSKAEFAGIVDGETLTVTATGAFGNKNAAADKKVTISGLTLGGTGAGNYELASEGQQTETKATINKKAVKVSGITAQDKAYDGNTNATLTFTGASFEGKVVGDTLSVKGKEIQTGTFNNKNVGTGKKVTLPGLVLDGTDAGNYTIKDDSQTEATANITAKAVNVTADDKSKTYGAADPELTYTADPLITGDSYSGVLTRKTGEDVNTYDIEQGTLTAGDNYTINFTKGTFTINKAMTNSVTVSIEGWTYGESPKSPGATATYGQDTATFAYSDSEKGEYKSDVPTNAGTWYVKATVAGTDNYVGAVSDPVEFTIAKKEVGLTWTDTELTYNGKAQKPKATATGLVDGDECDVTVDGAQTDANAKSGKDSYTATAASLSNANYKLPDNTTTEFTIVPKKLTQAMISLDSDTIKHDGTKKGPEVTMTDKDITEGEQPKQMAKDEDYTLSGDLSSSELGTHVITAEGKGNYSGSIETSWVMYSKKSNEQKEEGTGGRGDFEVFVDIENNSSTLTVDNLTIDLAKRFLTEEDMARYMEGEDVLVYMIVKEQPKSETGAGDRYILGQLFRGEGATDISWYDITVWKKVGNSAAVQVHDTVEKLSMSVEVPDGQKNAPEGYTREFYLGRSHDGVASVIAQTSEVKIGFGSDKFSTYALAYKDTEKPKDDPGKGGNGGNGGNGKGGSTSKGGTKTGDPNDIAGLLALMLASGGALGAMGYRRRKER